MERDPPNPDTTTPSSEELVDDINDVLWAYLTRLLIMLEDAHGTPINPCNECVISMAGRLARALGLSNKQVQVVRLAAMLHDIGNLHVPRDILEKPGPLNDEEYQVIQRHVQSGFEMMRDVPVAWPVAEIIHQHHERLDGSGYPNRLTREDILLESRVLAVADLTCAMLADKPYRGAHDKQDVIQELLTHRDTRYDADVVDQCVVLLGHDIMEKAR
jgi:putative nucleotidyltransferase with HDIG domain